MLTSVVSASGVSVRAWLYHQHKPKAGIVTDLAKGGFEVWNEAYPPPLHADNPQPLTPSSTFLFEDLIMHGSGLAPSGWQWFDSPRHLAGYLLYVGIPDIAAWWFNDSPLGNSGRVPLRDTVESAPQADPEDRAFFLAIADDLETLLAGPDPVNFKAISDVLDRFTARFGQTYEKTRLIGENNRPRWDMTLIAYPDAVSAGTYLWDEYDVLTNPMTGDDFADSAWLDLCARAGTDRAAGEVVTRVFEDKQCV
jgi:hypothetical protein